jgi:hypothetical protein
MAASTFVNLVRVYSNSAGTGPLVLGLAEPGFRGTEALTDGATYSYTFQIGVDNRTPGSTAYETGRGVWDAATSTLTRAVVESSLAGQPVGVLMNTPIAITVLAQDFAATDQAALAAAVLEAQQSATDADADAAAAAGSATSAAGSAATATTQAGIATTKAANAATSATAASGSAATAAGSATTSGNAAGTAVSSAAAANASATNAATSATAAGSSATAAAGSATAASGSASSAGTSASSALASSNAAATSAASAATSATSAMAAVTATAADRVQTGLDRSAASSSAAAAAGSAAAVVVSATAAGAYPNSAASNVPRGAVAYTLVPGSAGSNGTNIAATFSGGNFLGNPSILFDIVGGIVTNVRIISLGVYIGASPTVPTVSLPGSAGGASLTLTAGFLYGNGAGYIVQSADGLTVSRYINVSGVATLDTSVGPFYTQAGVESRLAGSTGSPVFITTSRTLTSTDVGKSVVVNIPGPGSSSIGTITIPSNSVTALPIGTVTEFVRSGGADIRFAPDSVGEAVISVPSGGKTAIIADNGWARLLKETSNGWRLYGQLDIIPPIAIAPKIWFDPSDLSTMKQERTGAAATTAAVVGQPVGSWRNKGSLGGWAVIDADAKRPILQQTGGYYEVVFDGVDDVLRLPTPALNLASIEIYLGFRYTGTTSANDGLLTLAPASSNDYNQHTGMSFYLSANGTQYNWVGDGNGLAGSTMIVSAAGVMTKNAHTVELRKLTANAATMTLDGNNSPGQVNQSSATTAFTTQGGDLILGARQGNGVVTWGHVAIRSVVITNEPVADPTSIRAYEEANTYGTVPVYPSIADTTALAAARATLVSEVFSTQGGVLPSTLGTLAIESPNPIAGTTTFTNLNKCEKMTIPGYAARPRLWTPNTPRSDVIFLVCAGHAAGWDANGISTFVMQPLLTANVRICTFVLPDGVNDYTSGGPTDHENNDNPLSDWVGPVSIAINKLKADFPSAAIYMTGISGGGWMTVMSAACDARIVKSYQFVGSLPDMIYLNRDWEQQLPGTTADFLTLYMLASCPARRHMQVLYENDPVAFNRTNFSTRPDYSAQMKIRAAAIGSGIYDLNWVNYNLHAYNSAFSSLVMVEV